MPSTATSATSVAAKVNSVQVPLRTELKNGDVVEVVTAPGSRPNPALAGFRAHRPGALQDPPSPEDHGAGGVARAGREAARAGAARRRPGEALGRSGRAAAAASGKSSALHRQPQPRRTAHRHRPGARSPASSPSGWPRCWPSAAQSPTLSPRDGPLHRATKRATQGRSHAGRQRRRIGAARHAAAGRCRATRSSATWGAARA